jgi:AbrB family looped-hinge helix DNA binding protein
MSVTLKPKNEITIPKSIRRKAGIKHGDQFDFSVSGRIISIIPKLSPDELQDEREIRDPKVRATIRKSFQEFLDGKTRPAEILQKELEKIAQTQAAPKSSAFQRRKKA